MDRPTTHAWLLKKGDPMLTSIDLTERQVQALERAQRHWQTRRQQAMAEPASTATLPAPSAARVL